MVVIVVVVVVVVVLNTVIVLTLPVMQWMLNAPKEHAWQSLSAAFAAPASSAASEAPLSAAASPDFPLLPLCLFLCGIDDAAAVAEALVDSAAGCLGSSDAAAAGGVEDDGMKEVEVSEETLIEEDEEKAPEAD